MTARNSAISLRTSSAVFVAMRAIWLEIVLRDSAVQIPEMRSQVGPVHLSDALVAAMLLIENTRYDQPQAHFH
jgi:hypothetical protein